MAANYEVEGHVAASSEVVLAYWTEHRQQFRQSEDQRAILTNYLLVITAGLIGLIAAQKFAVETLPAAILIIVFGLYGTLAVAKYHERASYHLRQARALTRTLKDLGVLEDNPHLETHRRDHYGRYPLLHRIRLHWLWNGLHLANATLGVVLSIIILAR